MRIEEKFEELEEKSEGAFMPHIYYGDPSEEFSLELVETLVESGADLLEFGIPFSDPTADGPTFQDACERALENGTTPTSCIEGIEEVRGRGVEVPIIVTAYYNSLYVRGVEEFVRDIKEAGAQGVIVPNLPVDEAGELLRASEEHGIDTIFLAAPTTTDERLEDIVEASSGFLYIMNLEGVTGAREEMDNSTLNLVDRVRERAEIPLMAGFGISRGEHARAVVSAGADGAIAGSAIGKVYAENLEEPEETLPEVANLVAELKHGCIEGYDGGVQERLRYLDHHD